ncbi:MAG TPA: PEP-CTERM sorting domain-containing protein [Lamprocystis sp. (in: g-proteobacteria)]|nr:PEP-CTERM sorting domain-containing protein [Lamprocystis sp. (in: g-proteobacteria)]
MQTRYLNPGLVLGGLALGLASLAFAPLVSAGAEAIATSKVVLSVDRVIDGDLGTAVTVTYDYDPADSTADLSSTGNAYANAAQDPSNPVSDTLDLGIYENQQSFSEAGAYAPVGRGFAALAGEGFLTLSNLGATALQVVFGYEIDLSVETRVTSAGFSDAYARAMMWIYDDTFAVDITNEVAADSANGPQDTATFADSGLFTVALGGNETRMIRIQTQSQAQVEFVPEPASLAMVVLGLVGLRIRRQAQP